MHGKSNSQHKEVVKSKSRIKIGNMKKKQDIVMRPATLTVHIGTHPVSTSREPIIHEKSVLDQLRVIIEKNNKIIEDSEKSS